MCKAVRFFCARETRGVFQPKNLASDKTGTIKKTVTSILALEHPHEKIPSCSTLETYDKTPILIPEDITEDAVELFVRKILGIYGNGGTDLEALQGCFLKYGKDRNIFHASVETFIDWLANKSPP